MRNNKIQDRNAMCIVDAMKHCWIIRNSKLIGLHTAELCLVKVLVQEYLHTIVIIHCVKKFCKINKFSFIDHQKILPFLC